MSKRYVLYGAGWQAECFYYQFEEKDKIDFVIDANREGDFHGRSIYRFEKVPCDLREYEIIIAAEIEPYFAIRKILEDNNYHNYVWSKTKLTDNRKIVIIQANCHGPVYQEFLLKNEWFNEHYRIIEIPQVQLYPNHCFTYGGLPVDLLENCDVYIHQDIRAENKISYLISDEYVLPRLKRGCKCITVPNMVGFGRFLYPTTRKGEEMRTTNYLGGGCKTPFWSDTLIDSFYHKYRDLSKIVKHLTQGDDTLCDMTKQLFEDCIQKLEKREENWDVKISDFIKENYRSEKLFYDEDHPTPFLMNEICNRLGNIMGLPDNSKGDLIDMRWQEAFVYPFVQNALELHWSDSVVRKNNISIICDKLSGGGLDLRIYIRQYIWWKFYDLL